MKALRWVLAAGLMGAAALPAWAGRNIVLNIPQRMIFLYDNGQLLHKWTVAVGNPASPTPLGTWKISEIRHEPTWYVPPSIQKEIKDLGGEIGTSIKPGDENPLGAYFLRLGSTTIGIHGTNRPRSLGKWDSHGCVRMHDEDVAVLAAKIKVGDPVAVTYERIFFNRSRTNLTLAVYPDGYQRQKVARSDVEAKLARELREIPRHEVDWQEVERIVARADGLPTVIWRAPLGANELD